MTVEVGAGSVPMLRMAMINARASNRRSGAPLADPDSVPTKTRGYEHRRLAQQLLDGFYNFRLNIHPQGVSNFNIFLYY